jgi:hypothetical protein
MCPCDLTREYVCGSCTAWIEERFRLFEAVEGTFGDVERELRGLLDRQGLKANIVIYQLTNGTRQYA